MKTVFGYSYQKLNKGGVLFQKGGVRNTTMSSGYKETSKPKDIKPEKGSIRTLYTEKIADTKNKNYGSKSGDISYQDKMRAKQQELVSKYGMLDDNTLINKFNAKEIDKETGQLLSDAFNRDQALKNNQTTYKRGFNSAIGLNPELDYLAAGKTNYNVPEPVVETPVIQKNKPVNDGLDVRTTVKLSANSSGTQPHMIVTRYDAKTGEVIGTPKIHQIPTTGEKRAWFMKSPLNVKNLNQEIDVDSTTAKKFFGN